MLVGVHRATDGEHAVVGQPVAQLVVELAVPHGVLGCRGPHDATVGGTVEHGAQLGFMLHPFTDDDSGAVHHIDTIEPVVGHLRVQSYPHRPVAVVHLLAVGSRLAHPPEGVLHEGHFGQRRRRRGEHVAVAAFAVLQLFDSVAPFARELVHPGPVAGFRAAANTDRVRLSIRSWIFSRTGSNWLPTSRRKSLDSSVMAVNIPTAWTTECVLTPLDSGFIAAWTIICM